MELIDEVDEGNVIAISSNDRLDNASKTRGTTVLTPPKCWRICQHLLEMLQMVNCVIGLLRVYTHMIGG